MPGIWTVVPGSRAHLLQLCLGYFAFYVIYGVALKYFQAPASVGRPGMNGVEWLVYSTAGGSVVALWVCLARRWFRIRSLRAIQWGPLRFPSEWSYILPSGVLTAVIIPATTLLYSLPISVMVAMVIMRGAVIVVSRIVDAVQIRQGLLRRPVHRDENLAVVFALLAVLTVSLGPGAGAGEAFAFLHSPSALVILGSYVLAYGLRIYIMNYFKNTRPAGAPLDNRGFFAVEQMSAFTTLVVVTAVLLALPASPGDAAGAEVATFGRSTVAAFQAAFRSPHADWAGGALAGTSFGIVAFFSVFIFMFQGRTATFAGLVNRLTSLVAGTTSTLLYAIAFGGRLPSWGDWMSLGFILVAVGLLTRAERRRAASPK